MILNMVSVAIEDGELFDFDAEVEPILDVLAAELQWVGGAAVNTDILPLIFCEVGVPSWLDWRLLCRDLRS